MEQVKKVKLTSGSAKLSKAFGVSLVTVGKALNGHVNTELAQKIRMAAINLGGDPIYESINP